MIPTASLSMYELAIALFIVLLFLASYNLAVDAFGALTYRLRYGRWKKVDR
jgi:hypothetical protein